MISNRYIDMVIYVVKVSKEFTKAEKSYIRHVQTPELLQRCMYVRHKIVK
jgi:hypothetical protein